MRLESVALFDSDCNSVRACQGSIFNRHVQRNLASKDRALIIFVDNRNSNLYKWVQAWAHLNAMQCAAGLD